jgi:ribonuclease-3 family protein
LALGIEDTFSQPLDATTLASLSPSVLAYVGDAVYELFVRKKLVGQGVRQPGQLHRETVKMVKAPAQAHLVQVLTPYLTPEEQSLIRRGRNSKRGNVPKGIEPIVYRQSTGLEVLIGYLFLAGQERRLGEILELALRDREEE